MSFRELSERVEDADFDIEVVAAELANIPESGQMQNSDWQSEPLLAIIAFTAQVNKPLP